MVVSTIALFASPIPTYDFEVPSTSSPPSTSPPRIIGGLSRLMTSTPTSAAAAATCYGCGGDEVGRHQSGSVSGSGSGTSPVSVFQGPGSGSTSGSFRGGMGNGLLLFDMEEQFGVVDGLLSGAQKRHGIFCDDFVVKAFYEAEKAHRGQVIHAGSWVLSAGSWVLSAGVVGRGGKLNFK